MIGPRLRARACGDRRSKRARASADLFETTTMSDATAVSTVLNIRTVQVAAMKTLVETLKDLLTDAIIEASPAGLKIIAMDTAHVAMVHMKLDAERFEIFECSRPAVQLSLNMLDLNKLIKTAGNTDTLSMYVEEDDVNHLYVAIENNQKNTRTNYKLKMLDIDHIEIEVPAERFDNIIVLNSVEFQKLCRDMSHIASDVEIKVVGGEVTFSCEGETISQETVFHSDCLVSLDDGETAAEIVQGVFPLKYLTTFTRCTNLSSTVEIFFKNSYPLIVRYRVCTLGEIKLACSFKV
jgi:proliferating cell nuclear antigen